MFSDKESRRIISLINFIHSQLLCIYFKCMFEYFGILNVNG